MKKYKFKAFIKRWDNLVDLKGFVYESENVISLHTTDGRLLTFLVGEVELLPDTEKSGISLMGAERQRQIDQEGYLPYHDAVHVKGELAVAAAIYIMPERFRAQIMTLWPWAMKCYKPCPDDRIKEISKGGALAAAEIDRHLESEGK